jgi:hypothetical protein
MGSALDGPAIRSYVGQMLGEMAQMLEDIGDPLAPEARALALRLSEKPPEHEHRPSA